MLAEMPSALAGEAAASGVEVTTNERIEPAPALLFAAAAVVLASLIAAVMACLG